ncbi:MAG: BCD family MFS transporter [Ardenticatenaceae bacterium]|nr:BCD family MFS transporter [Anaerolineales bacterium]MCB8921008.1 BCD family MFS transporter [Ardenticatenaceae bacterium]MCB9004197.1 BCD family MFS transporter [Ardenticatenaceae bacterium]
MKNAFNLIRLGGAPLSLTLISILAGSVINRVMVVELGLPETLAGLFLAVPLLVAPIRIWLGHLSDTRPLSGLRREPYIVIGAILSGLGAAMSVVLVLNTTSLVSIGALATLVALVVYGVGKNLANNTFQALLADKFAPGAPRARAANLYEVVKMVGLIAGAGIVGKALQPYSAERLTAVVVTVGVLAAVLSILAAIRQEPRTEAVRKATQEAQSASFGETFRTVLWNDPMVRLFFFIVTLTLLGTQMQDVLLEPYGGLVFGLDVGQTTQLTMFWGLGTLLSILLAGIFLLKLLGLQRVFRIGLGVVILLFPGIVLAGALQNANLLRLFVVGLGLGTGLSAASLLAYTVEFTTLKRAGLMVGVWGVGHQLGRALASMIGGALVDGMQALTNNNHLVAYGTAFMLEAVLLVGAFIVIDKLDMTASQAAQESELIATGNTAVAATD